MSVSGGRCVDVKILSLLSQQHVQIKIIHRVPLDVLTFLPPHHFHRTSLLIPPLITSFSHLISPQLTLPHALQHILR